MRAAAFCPGHVTGLFEIHRVQDLLATGSRGAGFCLSLGATSEVVFREEDEDSIEVTIDGALDPAPVTERALSRLRGERRGRITVDTKLGLPVSQGFGMSAAGSLSASLALADILGMDRQRAFEAAHVAEVECGCGLGDVSALHRAGITVRSRAGLPPRGEVLGIEGSPELILAVLGPPLATRDILSDPARTEAINRIGGALVDRLLAEPSFGRLMTLSRRFADESGLASEEVGLAIDSLGPPGTASMAMLGNSVFAVGDAIEPGEDLAGASSVFRCRVDTVGPRLLHS